MIPSELARRLPAARSIVVLTGSGISAESGVPTFRDAQTGLWACYRPEELATPEAFEADPDLVWRWYEWRRGLVRKAQPNAAHVALATLESRHPAVTVVTQNVDGLHQRAGSRRVIEFHGNLFIDRCSRAGCRQQPCTEGVTPRATHCPRCGARLRPGVVWFGESIPSAALAEATHAVEACDLFLSIGTSALVYPAAGLLELAARHGACVVEINPQPTPLSDTATFCIRERAATAVASLVASAYP